METMNKTRIAVIGAGASGIACATKLLEYGFQNIVVLEAENRIGGRIHTIPFADNVIDLGAQWCHGEKDNIVYELANRHDLLESTGDIYDNYQCIRSNGEVVSENLAQRLKNIVNESLVTRQMELRDSTGSLGDYLNQKFFTELRQSENHDVDMDVAREFFTNYKKFENSVEACDDLDEVSGRGYLEYWECEGELLLNWKDKGYAELLRLLMKSQDLKLKHGILENHILLNKIVTKISWNRPDNRVAINCGDGEHILVDHVIVTVSLGVLKEQYYQLFAPALPVEKQRAINGISFGTVNKLFLEFPSQFWPDNWTGFTLLWREVDLLELRGDPTRAWLEDVFGFYCISYQPRVLSAWIVGNNGRYMETLPEHELLDGCMFLLRKFLKWSIPEPLNFKASNWYTQTNFRGSYSFRSMLTEQVGTSARELAQPLTISTSSGESRADKPVVLFAGEATSYHYYSTVHGAVDAGWREAQRLADFYNLQPHASSHL